MLSDEYHGTHVAGIAASEIDNGEDTTGVGNSAVLSGRTLSKDGSGSTSGIADATWAGDLGFAVINFSLVVNSDTSTPLYILVDSYNGDGYYEISLTEKTA